MDSVYPNLFIVGAPKCGTSSLYHYLNQHPEIFMSSFKEPHYLVAEELKFLKDHKWITSEADYINLFTDGLNYKIRGEASAFYLYYHKTSIRGIQSISKESPYIIMILRNPVQRLISAYKHMIRTNTSEQLTFNQIVRARESTRDINHPMMYYKSMGKYSDMVENYIKSFSNVRVFIYEEFFKNVDHSIVDIWKFLDVDTNPEIDYHEKWNVKNYQWRSKGIQKLFISNNIFKDLIKKLAPDSVSDHIKSKFREMATKTPIINAGDEIIEELIDFYYDDVQRLSKILNKNLLYWLDPVNIRWK